MPNECGKGWHLLSLLSDFCGSPPRGGVCKLIVKESGGFGGLLFTCIKDRLLAISKPSGDKSNSPSAVRRTQPAKHANSARGSVITICERGPAKSSVCYALQTQLSLRTRNWLLTKALNSSKHTPGDPPVLAGHKWTSDP